MKTILGTARALLAGISVCQGGWFIRTISIASIDNNLLKVTNDGSVAGNVSGRVYVTTPTSAFGSPYNNQLNQNPGLVTWTFNMQQIRSDPSGFGSSSYGVAFVLGATSSDFLAANGYAVVLGGGGTPDPIRLVKFAGGIGPDSHLANIITGASPLNDIRADYLSLQVTYTKYL
jgi:hypothetical protein